MFGQQLNVSLDVAKSEIDDFDNKLLRYFLDEDIVWLDVAMDYILFVDVFQSQQYLSDDAPDLLVREHPVFSLVLHH